MLNISYSYVYFSSGMTRLHKHTITHARDNVNGVSTPLADNKQDLRITF